MRNISVVLHSHCSSSLFASLWVSLTQPVIQVTAHEQNVKQCAKSQLDVILLCWCFHYQVQWIRSNLQLVVVKSSFFCLRCSLQIKANTSELISVAPASVCGNNFTRNHWYITASVKNLLPKSPLCFACTHYFSFYLWEDCCTRHKKAGNIQMIKRFCTRRPMTVFNKKPNMVFRAALTDHFLLNKMIMCNVKGVTESYHVKAVRCSSQSSFNVQIQRTLHRHNISQINTIRS